MNFRQLIDAHAAYKDATRPPRTKYEMAKRCGVSRTQFFAMMAGTVEPKPYTVARVAKALRVDPETVEDALAESRREAGHAG